VLASSFPDSWPVFLRDFVRFFSRISSDFDGTFMPNAVSLFFLVA
jgi:hypothetical protein